ncbi:GntR family transcriptional regulator [Microbacterium azadirachtae]|uniref:GntR family transcriptional regulator n=1 Tax=Microbacterium azadirachtae TaxID=582680 RepID=UPI00088E71BF|nr:GntR family transcriptional regulator [Microbacterium azadirachtae]SDL91006.1 DNA-binding transcriptional regulator, GntR family [Microbacterium azadirachtae]SEG16718.1 DNA-binding transcriptional regulator, GntR family [Microbacterium azadirachtae]SEG19225.1 DNA-binding transcriptional regulator, GntR family [Microbacterium azadirachtae]
MAEESIKRGLLSDQVYDVILNSILDGSRPPGSRVIESETARQLGISQAPVREAVKRLVHAGLVESVPRHGSFVTEISPEEFAIARTMRASLEAEAARIAATLADTADLMALRDVVARMQVAMETDDRAAFRALDVEFHRRVIATSRRTVLARMWDTLEPILVSQRAIGDPGYLGERGRVVEWHADLIEALRAADPDAAAAAFAEHASGALDHDEKRP